MTSPLHLVPVAQIPRKDLAFARSPQSYPSRPPHLFAFRCDPPPLRRYIFELFARGPVACPEETITVLPDACVARGRFVITKDRLGVAESFIDAGQFAAADLMAPILADIDAGRCIQAPGDRPVFAIAKEGCDNYGHVLVEILPRLMHIAAMRPGPCVIIWPEIGKDLLRLVSYAAARLGITFDPLICPESGAIRAQRLHYVGPVSRHDVRKSPTLTRLIDRLIPPAGERGTVPRLFITRPSVGKRGISNREELEALAEAHGYRVVEPGAMSFPESIALFAGARDILAPRGAGLANAAFMSPGGSIAMLESNQFDMFFWDVACLRGHDFTWICTDTVVPFRPEFLDLPVSYDIGLVREALAWRSRGR